MSNESFKDLLQCKLAKLEQELVQAHLQVLGFLGASQNSFLDSPVPNEHESSVGGHIEALGEELADVRWESPMRDGSLMQVAEAGDRIMKKSTFENSDGGLQHQGCGASEGPRITTVTCASRATASAGDIIRQAQLEHLALRPAWHQARFSSKKSNRRGGLKSNLSMALSAIDRSKRGDDLVSNPTTHARADEGSKSKCIINPFHKGWLAWEMFGLVLLVHDIVFVPMQVFEIPPNAPMEALQWLTMLYWTLAFFLTFFVSFQPASQVALITNHKEICLHYLKGWFFLDLMLVASDWAGFAIELIVHTDSSSLRSSRMARLARLGRLFRTIRLLRMMRIGEILQRIEAFIDSEYLSIVFLIICNFIAILFLAHVAACFWFGIGSHDTGKSWLHPLRLEVASVSEQYMYSFGWALSTLLGTTVTHAYPESEVEYVVALAILIMGTIAVSLVFSSTTAALTRLQQLKSSERDATYKLKKFLRQSFVSSALEARVLRYVDIARNVHAKRISSEHVVLLHLLSGPLRLELELEIHAPLMIEHSFFNLYYLTNQVAMSEICLRGLGSVLLSRHDCLFRTFADSHHMYFLEGGVLVYRRAKGARRTRCRVKMQKGSNFCEPVLWLCWIHRGDMKALIESQIVTLNAVSFVEITESHHDIFTYGCEYAHTYLRQMRDSVAQDGYVWDVPSEIVYQEKYSDGEERSQYPGYAKILMEAEEVGAGLMDFQSDSDSEDERMLAEKLVVAHNLKTSKADMQNIGMTSDQKPFGLKSE